jgi:hypothetical protein
MLALRSTSFASLVIVLGFSATACSSTASSGLGKSNDADATGPDDGGGSAAAPPGPGDARGGTATPAPDATTGSGSDAGTMGDPAGIWMPSSSTPIHFHWELADAFQVPDDVIAGQGPIVYDIDGDKNDASTVAALHALGPNVKVVCYVDVGTHELDRSDSAQFPASVLGSAVAGSPGVTWLDVRDQATLLPIMKARLSNWCKDKGFDGVEPDNLDGWTNDPGFPITEAQNVSYDLAIASTAHALGLSVGVKNLMASLSTANIPSVENGFDWALTEHCFEYGQCDSYTQSFAAKGKATWDVEYTGTPSCPQAAMVHLNAQLRDMDRVAPGGGGYIYDPCISESQTSW